MSLERQCTVCRGKTFLQSDADRIRKGMTFSASLGQMIHGLPDMQTKTQAARKIIFKALNASSCTVSYVGKWKFPQPGRHIREFWPETPSGNFPMIELSAVNGQIFVSLMQSFSERCYYDAFLQELKEHGIAYTECGISPIQTADIMM